MVDYASNLTVISSVNIKMLAQRLNIDIEIIKTSLSSKQGLKCEQVR